MTLKPEDRALIEKVSHHLAYTLDTTGGFYGTLRAEQFAALLDAARSEGDVSDEVVRLVKAAIAARDILKTEFPEHGPIEPETRAIRSLNVALQPFADRLPTEEGA